MQIQDANIFYHVLMDFVNLVKLELIVKLIQIVGYMIQEAQQ